MQPRDEYVQRLDARRSSHRRQTAADARIAWIRLALFAVFVVLAILGVRGIVSWWWLAAPVVIFALVARRHDAVIRARDAAARAVSYYERGMARIDDTWAGSGETGEQFADGAHLYAADLDLFGRGSLFQLLSVARTRVGEATLARWLMHPEDATGVRERQAAVRELAERLDLREEVALAGEEVHASVHGDALLAWAERPPLLTAQWMRGVAALLTVAAVGTIALWIRRGDAGPLVAVVLIQLAVFFWHRPRLHQALHMASGWSADLDVLAHVLDRIEQDTFTAPLLSTLRHRLDSGGSAPGRAIRHLHRLVEMHDWQHNLLFAVIALPLLWDVHLAFAMEAWRARHGRRVRLWLESVGEFEALSSLATYRYEHPDDPFPDIDDTAPPLFDGAALGHPLLPSARLVRNDVRLGHDLRLLIVSGSNMSGKSTLLRTVGINAALALAGAPVRAASLRLTPLAIGATLRIQDSLQEGRSRFYAEITRVRDLAQRAQQRPPLLFLLDELFHGTNSHDRLIGASGVLRSFIDRGAIGLVTTHDLALTAVADELAPAAANVHFDDRFERGEIVFDYRMKPGPVTHSNAIALMRAVGLDVDGT